MESAGSITVRVKSASLSCEDIVVECNLSYKVKQLKELIRLKSPMHPEIGDQRLIYAGHLLDDEQILKDVLLGNGESVLAHASFTVHLATTLRGLGKSNQQQQQENSKKETSPSVSVPSGQQSSSSSSSATPQSTSSIRAESTPNVELPHFQSMRTGIPPDVLALHQYYVEQMMQYMMQWSQMTLGFAPPTPIFTAAANNISTSSYIPPPPPVRHPEEPAIIPQNIDVQENVRVNEVANRGGEEEEAPRDVLDWMYTVVRVALIFSVVYFYSNFTRFFLVVLFTALVMVFQRRQGAGQAEINAVEQRQEDRANIPRAQDEIPNPQQVPTPAPSEETTNNNNTSQDQGASTSETQSKHDTPVLNETESAGNRSDTTGNSSETSNLLGTAGTEPTLTEISEPRRSIRDITLTFLTTFFTSLIPEIPQNN